MNTWKVKRSSWHYTLYCFLRQGWERGPFEPVKLAFRRSHLRKTYKPKSLCSYFWFCLLSAIFMPILMLVAGLFLGVAFIVVFPFVWIGFKISDRSRAKRYARQMKEGKFVQVNQPSMLRTFVKSRKNKVCPIIEVVD